jgi:hypothetical protein
MKMTMMLMTAVLGTVATLAAPVVAQNVGSADAAAVQNGPRRGQKPGAKLASGEAANLQKAESGQAPDDASTNNNMREDNRGRVTSARHAALQPRQISKTASSKKHNATAHVSNVSQKRHAAKLKTGQLTTPQSAHLQTKQTALRHQVHSSREPDVHATPEDQPNKNTSQIHLKKHNARMF